MPRSVGGRGARTFRGLLVGAAGAAVLLTLLLVEAGRYPGLQADEAWSGLTALAMVEEGITTPHGMNAYTAPVLPWLLARSFEVWTPGVLTLRTVTAALAALGLFFLLFGIVREVDLPAGALFFALFASCLLWTWYGRVAFEVIGLQDLLLGVVIATTLGFAATGVYPFFAVAAFLYATAIGVLSHFIFLIVPAGLATASVMLALARRDAGSRKLLSLALVAVLMAGGLVALKTGIGQEAFLRQRRVILPALLAAPLAVTTLYRAGAPMIEHGVGRALDGVARAPRAAGMAWALCGAGLVYAFAHHGVALVQVYSSIPVIQRFASWTPPFPVQLLLYGWAGALAVATIAALAFVRTPDRARAADPLAALLALWLAAVLAWLAVSTTGNSIRYYRLPALFAFLAIAVGLARRSRTSALRAAALALIPAVAMNAWALRETRTGSERPPIRFRIGSLLETSAHFMRLDGLEEFMREERSCDLRSSYFIQKPVEFRFAVDPWDCDPRRQVEADYCYDCDAPPYVSWGRVRNPSR